VGQALPVEGVWPLGEIKLKFEPQVSWERDEIIEIIGSEDSSDMGVGADIDGPDLVAALDEVGGWQDAGLLEDLEDIEDHHTPAIVLEIERHLSHEAIGSVEVLE
jgi:hypothetical protein